MQILKSLGAGVVVGLVGTLVWGILASLWLRPVGWVGVAIGFGVGLAVFWGSRRQSSLWLGAGAAAVTLASILAGHLVGALHVAGLVSVEADADEVQRQIMIQLARTICEERLKAGEDLEFPDGMTLETAEAPADFPPGIAAAVGERWKTLTQDQKEQQVQSAHAVLQSVLEGVQRMVLKKQFLQAFGGFELFWIVLSGAIAFQIGSGGEFQKKIVTPG